jgi:hypothetical protein
MKRVFIFILLSALFTVKVSAQKEFSVELLEGSFLTIKGNSNVVPFKINLRGDDFPKDKFSITAVNIDNKVFISDNRLNVDVKNFSSDNKMALRDFKKLLKYREFPYLSLEVVSLVFKTRPCGNVYGAEAVGILTVGGVRKEYEIPLTLAGSTPLNRATGHIKLNIKDFGLEPPVEMMGLIKVSEWIEIDFNLHFNLTEAG